mmetsp:Transcript_20295/g.22989  ORF Transcript_20295/g.22989 Transcript_20295/m.22989 type:complete len:386 (-) Transcript_20295:218-1375(-)
MEGVEEEKELTLQSPGVLDKYQAAAKVANEILQQVVAKVVPGASVHEICTFGDKALEEGLKGVYNKKGKGSVEKGIAFPTCVSVNELCGHVSPLPEDDIEVKEGDVVKIDLGTHIDGFAAIVAHTVVAQAEKKPVEGRKADVILAAHTAAQAGLRVIRPGSTNTQVTEAIQLACDAYKCNPVEGVLSHEMKRHLIDGNKVIINKETVEQKVEEFEFGLNEVYGLDIIVSTGEGKPKEAEVRTTVYKRAIENAYSLKLKNSRAFFKEVNARFPTLPFSLGAMSDDKAAKVGVVECVNHNLLHPYPVLKEKEGDIVAHFKYTVLLLGKGTVALTQGDLVPADFTTENKVEDENLLKILNTSMSKNKQKKNKKKKEAASSNDQEEKKD